MSKSIECFQSNARYHVEGNKVYSKQYVGTTPAAKRSAKVAEKEGRLVKSKHGNFIKIFLFTV